MKTKALMLEVGQDPIILNKEINGFVLNRIQYAIFGECYRLVEVSSTTFVVKISKMVGLFLV